MSMIFNDLFLYLLPDVCLALKSIITSIVVRCVRMYIVNSVYFLYILQDIIVNLYDDLVMIVLTELDAFGSVFRIERAGPSDAALPYHF